MKPPICTMTIDFGPNLIVVISGNSLYELVDKMLPSGVSLQVVDKLKHEMSRKSKGYKAAEKHFLLDGRVQLDVKYPEEWIAPDKRVPWYNQGIKQPPAYFYECGQ